MSEIGDYSRPGHGIPLEWERTPAGEQTGEPFIDGLVAWTRERISEIDSPVTEADPASN